MSSLYDDDDPDPRPAPKQPPATSGRRGRETKPERQQRTADLKEVLAGKDEDALRRAMATSLYRLGAEPLNAVAKQMLSYLEGNV